MSDKSGTEDSGTTIVYTVERLETRKGHTFTGMWVQDYLPHEGPNYDKLEDALERAKNPSGEYWYMPRRVSAIVTAVHTVWQSEDANKPQVDSQQREPKPQLHSH